MMRIGWITIAIIALLLLGGTGFLAFWQPAISVTAIEIPVSSDRLVVQ